MGLDLQTAIIAIIITAAAVYVARKMWPRPSAKAGCDACPQNRDRNDDYA